METEASARRTRKPPEERRADILAAAQQVFSEHSYRVTDVQHIAERAGVGKGTVYRFFATKEELFLAAVSAAMDDLAGQVARALEFEDPLERLRQGVTLYLQYFDDRPEVVELFVQERAEFPDRTKPTYFLYEDSDGADWIRTYEELVSSGRARAVDPREAFRTFADLLYGTVLSQHLAARPGRLARRAETIFDLLLHGLLGGSASPNAPGGSAPTPD